MSLLTSLIPDDIIIEQMNLVHGRCMNYCVHCGYPAGQIQMAARLSEEDPGDTSVWMEAMDLAHKADIRTVVLTGGDPSERKDFRDLLVYAFWLGLNVKVETHARRFSSPDFVRSVQDAQPLQFLLSLHGSTPKTHDRITQQRKSFEQTVKGIRNIRKVFRTPLACTTVLSSYNITELIAIFDLCCQLGIDYHIIVYPEACGEARAHGADIMVSYEEVKQAAKQLLLHCERGSYSCQVRFNNMPLCVLDGSITNSLNYPLYRKSQIGYELVIFPFALSNSYIAEMRIPPSNASCSQCERCYYRHICPGPSITYIKKWGEKGLHAIQRALTP